MTTDIHMCRCGAPSPTFELCNNCRVELEAPTRRLIQQGRANAKPVFHQPPAGREDLDELIAVGPAHRMWANWEDIRAGHVHVICPVCGGCQTGGCDLRGCSCAAGGGLPK